MEKIETPVNRLRRILHESGTISDLDWQEAIEAEQIEMMTAVDLFVYHKKFTEDAFKTWYAEHYQEMTEPPTRLAAVASTNAHSRHKPFFLKLFDGRFLFFFFLVYIIYTMYICIEIKFNNLK